VVTKAEIIREVGVRLFQFDSLVRVERIQLVC
jgi:hypothetical protein